MLHHLTLKLLFKAVACCPGLLLRWRSSIASLAWRLSGYLRRVCTSNGRFVLGPDADDKACAAYGRAVVSEFLRFIADIAHAHRLSKQQILERVADIEGRDHFEEALAMGRGLIIATCHLGNFEVGAVAVAERVPETHVLFHGDVHGGFEQMRADLHRQLGLTEAHVEKGLEAWMQLRDALARGGAVLIQADRCMPGQPGTAAPFLHGHVEMPDGPAKLARITNAPIVPIVASVQPDGRVMLHIDTPIDPEQTDPHQLGEVTRQRLADFFSGIIRNHPAQWHTLHRAFVENQGTSKAPTTP